MPLKASYLAGHIPAPMKVGNLAGDDNIALVATPSFLMRQTFVNPSTIDADGISVSHVGASSAGTRNMTIGGALASGGVATLTPARNVVITVTHATSVVAMNGTITGKRFGRTLTEDWSVTAGTTSKTFTGKKAFDKITQITETIAADASTNTIVAGDCKVLGLTFKNSITTPVKELENGAPPTAGVLVAASTAASADPRGTYTPNSTLNGALDFDVWYISDDLATLF